MGLSEWAGWNALQATKNTIENIHFEIYFYVHILSYSGLLHLITILLNIFFYNTFQFLLSSFKMLHLNVTNICVFDQDLELWIIGGAFLFVYVFTLFHQ